MVHVYHRRALFSGLNIRSIYLSANTAHSSFLSIMAGIDIIDTTNERYKNTTKSGLLVLYLNIYCVNSISFSQISEKSNMNRRVAAAIVYSGGSKQRIKVDSD